MGNRTQDVVVVVVRPRAVIRIRADGVGTREKVLVLDRPAPVNLSPVAQVPVKTVHDLVGAGERKVLLNLAKVTHIDSSGLCELVASHATLEKNDGEMKLLNLTERVAELMTITKLLTVFDMFDNEEIAVASFGSAAGA